MQISVNDFTKVPEGFATENKQGSCMVHLWNTNEHAAHQGSSIVVRRDPGFGGGNPRPAFYVLNHAQTERTVKDCGGRTTNKPYTDSQAAFAAAQTELEAAVASGKWSLQWGRLKAPQAA